MNIGNGVEKIILHNVDPVEHAVCLECANRLLKVEDDNMRCPLCRHLIAVTKKNHIIEKWRKINGMPPSLQEEEKITIDLLKELFSDFKRLNSLDLLLFIKSTPKLKVFVKHLVPPPRNIYGG